MKTLAAQSGELQFAVVDGLEATRQRVEQRLRFLLGEWFLNTRRGIPYLQEIIGATYDEALVKQILNNEILLDDEVTSISDVQVSLDFRTRALRYSVSVSTIHGDMTVSG